MTLLGLLWLMMEIQLLLSLVFVKKMTSIKVNGFKLGIVATTGVRGLL